MHRRLNIVRPRGDINVVRAALSLRDAARVEFQWSTKLESCRSCRIRKLYIALMRVLRLFTSPAYFDSAVEKDENGVRVYFGKTLSGDGMIRRVREGEEQNQIEDSDRSCRESFLSIQSIQKRRTYLLLSRSQQPV